MEENIVESKREEILATIHYLEKNDGRVGAYTTEQKQCQNQYKPRTTIKVAKKGHYDVNEVKEREGDFEADSGGQILSVLGHFASNL
jgi:hypothetical protein